LVEAFAEQMGGRVLVGACEHLTTPAPLGPLLDVSELVGLERDLSTGRHPRHVALSLRGWHT
jgi:hypothetical protein